MWAKRSDLDRTLSVAVDLDPARCLDTAEFLARNAAAYGIEADLDFRRNRSGRVHERHFVVGRQPDGPRSEGVAPSGKLLWVLHVELRDHHSEETEVRLGLHDHRRSGRRSPAMRAAGQYRELLSQALVLLHRQRLERLRPRPVRDRDLDNVVPLRPFQRRPPLASA